MKICLINPPSVNLSEIRGLCSHLGLGYIAAILINAGHEVDLFDCPIENMSLRDINEKIREGNYNAIGISTYFFNYHNVLRITKGIKKLSKDIFVFLGGYLPTLAYDRIGKDLHDVDCMVVGEGEITTLELIENLVTDQWRKVPGIVYVNKENKQVIFTGKRVLVDRLDEFSFPVRVVQPNAIELDIITARGCYGRCSFCAMEGYHSKCIGRKVRRRSPDNVVEEIEYLLENYKLEWINFADDCFSLASKEDIVWFDRFIYLIKQRNIQLKYSCFIRANEIINSTEKVKEFMSIGLSRVFVGIESFLQNHLEFYNKKVTVEENLQAVSILDALNLTYNAGYILFNPITTMDDIKKTIDIFQTIKFNSRHKYIMVPISGICITAVEGSPFSEYVQKNGLSARNSRGYIIKNEQVELCLQVMINWSKNYNVIISKYYIEKMAADLNELSIIQELRSVFYEMFCMDLQILKEVAHLITEEGYKTLDDFNDALSKWEKTLADLEQAVMKIESKITSLGKGL